METTRRRFAEMSCCLASRPTCSMRMRRRCSARVSSISPFSAASSFSVASVPASIFMARWTSSSAVSRSTLPISLRYMRTGSPVSMTVEVSCRRAWARLERLGFETLALGTERRASLISLASLAASDSSSSSPSRESSSSEKSSSEPKSSSSSPASMEPMPKAGLAASPDVVISTPLARSVS